MVSPPEFQRVYRKAHVILVNQAGTRPAKRAPTTAARPTKPRCYKAAVGKPAPRTKRLRDTRQAVHATNTNRPPKRTSKKRAAEKALPRDQDRAQPVKCRREHAAPRSHKVVDEICGVGTPRPSHHFSGTGTGDWTGPTTE